MDLVPAFHLSMNDCFPNVVFVVVKHFCKPSSVWYGLIQVLIYSPDGRCLFKYQAYESGLGVKSVSWSPCGQFLAVGSYDQMLRVLNHLTWKTFAEFMHPSTVRSPCCPAVFKVIFVLLFRLKCTFNP